MDQRKLAEFRRFVSTNSVTGNEEMFRGIVEDRLKELGFRTYGDSCLFGEMGKGGKIGILGHLDTFPPRMGWAGDPFRLRVVGRKGFGLGTFDMKGGIFAFLNSSPDIPMKVAFATNEIGMRMGSWEILNSGFFSDVDMVISLHGTEFGPRSLIVGRMGEIVIKITLVNRKENPIPESAKLIEMLTDDSISFHPHLGFSSIEPIKVESLGKVRSEPEKVIIEFKRTLLPNESPESALQKLRSEIYKMNLSSAVKIGLKKGVIATPSYESEISGYAEELLRIVRSKFISATLTYLRTPGVENLIAQIKPVVSIGPRGGNRGMANEWVDLKSIEKTSEVLSAFFSSLP